MYYILIILCAYEDIAKCIHCGLEKNRKLSAYLRHEQIQFKESRISGQERSRNISPIAQIY